MTATAPRRSDGARLALAALLLLAWDACGADMVVSAWFGNSSGFAWRHHALTQGLLHDGGRWLAALLVSLGLIQIARANSSLSREHRRAGAIGLLLCFVVVPSLKQFSPTSCPYELAAFGGQAQWLSHWRVFTADGGPGHCFPSGHAVSGFGLLPLWALWRRRDPVRARRWCMAAIGLGLLFGLGQVVRGAHFASHVGWSLWLCTVAALSWQAWIDQRARRTPDMPAPIPGHNLGFAPVKGSPHLTTVNLPASRARRMPVRSIIGDATSWPSRSR